VTRAVGQAESIVGRLEGLGAEVLSAPSIEIAPPESYDALDAAVAEIGRYRLIGLTSANAVDGLFGRLDVAGLDARALAGKVVAVVGEKTREALAARGVRADVVAAESTAEGLAHALATPELQALVGRGPVLLPRAAEGRLALAEALRARGLYVDAPAAYRALARPPERLEWVATELAAGRVDAATFGSPKTAAALVAALPDPSLLEGVVVGAVGPTTEAALVRAGVRVDVVASPHTFDALVDALIEPTQARAARRARSLSGPPRP
jgi:uroporphyrinogen III methyltransferase/synthase